MWRECKENCPIQKNNKCLSGNAHKKDFGTDCEEKKKIIDYYKNIKSEV